MAALSRGPTHMEVWWVGWDGSVQGAWWTEDTNTWQRYPLVAVPLSASPSSGIAALSRGPSHMEVWWVGADGSVQGAWWTEAARWQPPYPVPNARGASPSSGIAALSAAPAPGTHMEVWWIGADGSVWHSWFDDSLPEGHKWVDQPKLVPKATGASTTGGIAVV